MGKAPRKVQEGSAHISGWPLVAVGPRPAANRSRSGGGDSVAGAMYSFSWKGCTTVGAVGCTAGAAAHTRSGPVRRVGIACRAHAAGANGITSSSAVVSAVGTGSGVGSVVPALYGGSSRRRRGLLGVVQCRGRCGPLPIALLPPRLLWPPGRGTVQGRAGAREEYGRDCAGRGPRTASHCLQ